MNVVLLALAAGRFLSKESTLAAVHRVIQTPAALSDARGNADGERLDGMGGAIAAAAEAKMGIEQSLEHVWAENNATLDALRRSLADTVRRTTARLDAGVAARAAMANASTAEVIAHIPNVSTLVDPTAVIGEALEANATVANGTLLRNTTENNTANMARLAANLTVLYPLLAGRVHNTSELANFTHDYVHAIVDPHWGPRAVNASANASTIVEEARVYSSAVDFQVQSAMNEATMAEHDGEDAMRDADVAMREAQQALEQAKENTLKLKAARTMVKQAEDKAEGSNVGAADAAARIR